MCVCVCVCDLLHQVTVQYRQDRGAMLPLRVHTVVVSVQHDEVVSLEEMRASLKECVVRAVVPPAYLDDDTVYHLQPSGRFVIGGPQVTVVCTRANGLRAYSASLTSGHSKRFTR